jgi:hypothetical protein
MDQLAELHLHLHHPRPCRTTALAPSSRVFFYLFLAKIPATTLVVAQSNVVMTLMI